MSQWKGCAKINAVGAAGFSLVSELVILFEEGGFATEDFEEVQRRCFVGI